MEHHSLIEAIYAALSFHCARLWRWYAAFALVLLVVLSGLYLVIAPPLNFPTGKVIEVPYGTSVRSIAAELKAEHVVRYAAPLRYWLRLTSPKGIQAGPYSFTQPATVFTVANHLARGFSGIPTVKLTFPEGTTVRQMGALLAKSLPNFSEQTFDTLALGRTDTLEGYLFPDTYFFLPGTGEQAAIDLMHANYEAHIKKYADAIAASGNSENEIITMASLLEGEGKTLDDRRIIAGILWKRLKAGMGLQVDAPFGYIYGVTGYTPTPSDLKSDSAYNTYRHQGLPPTPINNPGDDSILAALTPTKTDYLYYLTGSDGQMHYAKTFAEHKANQLKYFK